VGHCLSLATPGSHAPCRTVGRLSAGVGAVVFCKHVGGQPSVLSDPETLFFRPGANGTAPLTALPSPRLHTLARSHWTGMVDERRQLLAEALSVLGVQVNFKVPAIDPERNRLVSRTACQIVHELSLDSLHSLPPEM
jgi:hypothetical protein